MIEIRGQVYRQDSSDRQPCILQVDDNGNVILSNSSGDQLTTTCLQDMEISSRLGNTPRFLKCPNGLRVETQENDKVDQVLEKYLPQPRKQWLHLLETRARFVLVTLIAVVAFVWGVVQFGAPAIAKIGSKWVPQDVVKYIGEQSLASMDKFYFKPSALPENVQDRVRNHFRPLLADHSYLNMHVIFRSNEHDIPNAFALPDGTLIFTDAMVKMAKEDDELLAIAAHEVGHVRYRHGMRHMIQSSILAFLATIITGDVSGTSDIFMGIPVMLTELSYSRDFEREADGYAFRWLREHHKSTLLFANIMSRLENITMCDKKQEDCQNKNTESHGWLDYFSTHPPSEERITKAINGNSK